MKTSEKLRSVGYKIILKPQKPDDKTSGRHGKKILLTKDAQLSNEWEQECVIVSVGPKARIEMLKKGRAFAPGDRVVMSVYQGLDGVRAFKRDGVKYQAIDYHQLVGRIMPEAVGRVTVDGRGTW